MTIVKCRARSLSLHQLEAVHPARGATNSQQAALLLSKAWSAQGLVYEIDHFYTSTAVLLG